MAPVHEPLVGMTGKVTRAWRWFWSLLLRNRLAIAVASLLWLIFRSGTQPRRLSYPCQQVAAINVSAFAAGLIPTLFLVRKRDRHMLPRAVVVRRQLLAAGIMFVVALIGIEGYQFAQSLIPPELPAAPARAGDPQPAIVGIARQNPEGAAYTLDEIVELVARAVARAGGLDAVVDPGDHVVIKPNLVQDFWDATQGVVTDPRVCYAIAKLAKEAGAGQVTIAEGTAAGGTPSRNITWNAYVTAGYDTNGDHLFDCDPSVALFDLNDSGGLHVIDPNKVTLVALPAGVAAIRQTPFQYYVPNILLECDVLISVPTFKNHYNGTVTLAMKNRVGCAPNDLYHGDSSTWGAGIQGKLALVHYTDQFGWNVPPAPANENEVVQRTIVDLNLVRPNDFAVVDGLIGITNGPNEEPLQYPDPLMHMIVAGRDSMAVDTVCTLAMGYDQEYVPHLAWADSAGVLGTKDPRYITVAGDHVAAVRSDDFPAGHGGAVLIETTPPTIGDISWSEGEPIPQSTETTVTATGTSDNVGIVKAQLAVCRTDLSGLPDLVVNGDFETGDSSGWTTWSAPWGSGEAFDFASAEPGHEGNSCLNLKIAYSSIGSSFGVYQEIPVTPGRTYRLDARWKGLKKGDDNWYEILILNGPWDEQQADSGEPPAQYVVPNYMYAYDNNTYPLPGDFGWIEVKDQNQTPVDWNDRDGYYTPTGNVITIVLKAGACCGTTAVDGWFEKVTLVQVPEPQVVATTFNPAPKNPGSPDYPTLDPQDPINLVWDSVGFPTGPYQATVTVYDDALNEASITRNIELVAAEGPIIQRNPLSLSRTTHAGESPPNSLFEVRNCGTETLNYTIENYPGWLDVLPLEGSSTGQWNSHEVHYHTGTLLPGTHVGTIEIHGNAVNSPRPITVTVNVETVICDFAPADGDVDLDDFAHMQACFTGSGVLVTDPNCLDADLDGDHYVDRDDLAILRGCMSGAKVIADKTCDDEYQ